MEDIFRYGLLFSAVLVLGFILYEAWSVRRSLKKVNRLLILDASFKKNESIEPSCVMPLPTTEKPIKSVPKTANAFLTLSVFAKANSHFASYDLLQAISAAGLQFGEMNIFHYYLVEDNKKIKLFSLASATKPGDFDLDRMGDFTCVGLTLFMDLQNVPDPEKAFSIMLRIVEQLADDLDGEIFAGPQKPWNNILLQEYQQRIIEFKKDHAY